MKDIVNEYLDATLSIVNLPGGHQLVEIRPHIVCNDGFTVSVQASHTHYCTPRLDHGPYIRVELGYPSAQEVDLMEWAEGSDVPTSTVYGYVPIEIVAAVIQKHGGIDHKATGGTDDSTTENSVPEDQVPVDSVEGGAEAGSY